jgi:pyrroloquinoline-quinone synthase
MANPSGISKGNKTIMSDQHLSQIDSRIAAKHLLQHPFYLAWTRGELSREALADYATQYYHHVAAFPTYLSSVHSHCDDQWTRKMLLENLSEEESGNPNHPELWLNFANSLGAQPSTVQQSEQRPETSKLIETFRSICRDGSVAEGLAALYAYESQIPAVSESKIEGLRKHYGMNNPEDYRYFSVHIEADEKHAAVERELLKKWIDKTGFENVLASVDRTLDALWSLLSGVCQRHAIAC